MPDKVADNIVFGCTKKSDVPDDHVEDLWANSQEDKYAQVKRKEVCLPDFIQDPEYRHGITTSKTSDDAKQLIYAANCCENTNTINTEPGQQMKRNYNWPAAVNPNSTVFGITGDTTLVKRSSAGVSEALCMKDDSIDEAVETKAQVDSDKVFGKSTSESNSSTAECLWHDNQDNDGSVDAGKDDLGKSLTPGFRNASTNRCFGTPSIRTGS